MKLVVFYLFAVCGCSLVNASRSGTDTLLKRKKLQEVLRQLKHVKQSLQNNNQMLNTPPEDIEDCCCLSALQCFRANLNVQFKTADRKTNQLHRSLQHNLTVRGLDFCNSANSTCQDCDAHPKENANTFFNRLESLIQRGIIRLSMK